jgi:hypothetical protein
VTGSGSQRARIDHGFPANQPSVDWNHLASTHEYDIAGLHALDGHRLQPLADPQPRDLRGALDERGQLPPRPRRGDVLERRAAREHQTDDHSCELLAEQ